MKKKSTVVFLAILCCILSPLYGQWTKHIIDPDIAYTCFIDVYDIGDDGDMDVFVSEYGKNTVLWYENYSFTWIKHTIDNNLPGVVGLDLLDVNDDGNMDVTAASWSTDVVLWYENDGADPINWTKHIIDNTLDGAEVVRVQDINGDGVLDIVAAGDPGRVVWYENNYPMPWISHDISLNVPGGSGNMYVADINNDDKPDVLRSGLNKVILLMNNLPDTVWTKIIIDGNMPGVFQSHIADIDNDGDMDVTSAAEGATGSKADVAWYENDGSGQTWTKHTISTDLTKARCLYIEDIDNNGYMDVLVADNYADDIILFFNMDGGQNWTEKVVDNNFDAPNPVFAFDIDLDNDFDILPTSQVNNALVWYENPHGTVYAQSMETSPFSIQSLDTLTVRAYLSNPENHPVNVFAVIQGDQFQFRDSMQLFDDGLHSDSDSADNVWGNIRLSSGFPEDEFKVDLFTYDSIIDVTLGFQPPARFITFGPVAFEDYSFTSSDTVPNPGNVLRMAIALKNNGSLATVSNIKVNLISLDALLTIRDNSIIFSDIPAGESSPLKNIGQITISKDCPWNTEVAFEVNISSYGNVCWRDTFSILVLAPDITNIEDSREPITRIYPNPTNDLLTIETNKPGSYYIEITSLNGQLISSFEMEGPSHQVDLSPIPKGVYFITIRSEDFVTTEKIIKL